MFSGESDDVCLEHSFRSRCSRSFELAVLSTATRLLDVGELRHSHCVCVQMLTVSNLATFSALQNHTVWLLTATHPTPPPTPHPTRSSVCVTEVCSERQSKRVCVCVKMLTVSNLATLSALQSHTVWLLTATHPTPHPQPAHGFAWQKCAMKGNQKCACVEMR